MRPPQHPRPLPPSAPPAPRRRGPFLQPVSSSENVNERQGDASRVEASAEAPSPWTWGAGSRGACSPRAPLGWSGRLAPMPVAGKTPTQDGQQLPRARREARQAWAEPTAAGAVSRGSGAPSLHVRVGGPWACALCSCPGAPDQRGSGGSVEHPRGHVRSRGSASEGWR